jgi:hypothetical protein
MNHRLRFWLGRVGLDREPRIAGCSLVRGASAAIVAQSTSSQIQNGPVRKQANTSDRIGMATSHRLSVIGGSAIPLPCAWEV